MKKICKKCGKEIKGTPTIYDYYYFCNSKKEKTDKTCLGKYLNLYQPED